MSLYERIGGLEGCRALSADFYGRVVRDPILKPLFPSVHCAIEALARFLAQSAGGPCLYSKQRWYLTLREAHARFRIGERERDAWMRNMSETLAEMELGENERSALHGFCKSAAAYLAGSEEIPVEGELAQVWDEQLALEDAVAMVRSGVAPDLAPLECCFLRDPMARLGLLAIMIGVGMMGPVQEELSRRPELAQASYVYGRTLVHDASVAGSVEMVELLLQLGADPNGSGEGHTPLYETGNGGRAESCGAVVRILVRAGADVNRREGAKKCTALHMAARRGNIVVAQALLECGADPSLRDSAGVTPRQRAINCRKTAVAKLLDRRGGPSDSVSSPV